LCEVILSLRNAQIRFAEYLFSGYFFYESFLSSGDEGEFMEKFYPYIGLAVLALLVLLFALLPKTDKKNTANSTFAIAFGGICVAMSFVLSLIPGLRMPQGGTVSWASMLPLVMYAYVFGFRRGLMAGFLYGLIDAMMGGYIINVFQFLLDYPLAFAAVGFAGLFGKINIKKEASMVSGILLYTFIRYIMHVMSGIIFFSEYAGGKNPLVYSMIYNAFLFIDTEIVMLAAVYLMQNKGFMGILERLKGNRA